MTPSRAWPRPFCLPQSPLPPRRGAGGECPPPTAGPISAQPPVEGTPIPDGGAPYPLPRPLPPPPKDPRPGGAVLPALAGQCLWRAGHGPVVIFFRKALIHIFPSSGAGTSLWEPILS
eukprot:gene19048-biopygen19018